MNENQFSGMTPETPVQPVPPVAPTAPAEPMQPMGMAEPVAPVAPAMPEAPVQPNIEVAPVPTLEPAAPMEPVAPVAPEPAPVAPVAPAMPEAPVQPMPTPVAPMQDFGAPALETVTNKKSKTPIILAVVAIILVACGVGAFLFLNKAKDPKTIVTKTINSVFKNVYELEDEIDKQVQFDYKEQTIEMKNKVVISAETTEPSMKELLAAFNNIEFSTDIVVNLKGKELSLGLKTGQNSKDILTADVFLSGNKVYANSNVLDRPLLIELEGSLDEMYNAIVEAIPEGISMANAKVLTEKFEEALNKAIKEEYLSQEKGNYKVGGSDVSGIRTTITLTEKRAMQIMLDILKALKDDGKFMETAAKMSGAEKKDLEEALNEQIKEGEEAVKNASDKQEDALLLHIYTSSLGKFKAFELFGTDEKKTLITVVEEKDTVTYKLFYDTEPFVVNYDKKSKTYKFEIDEDGTKISVEAKMLDNGAEITVKAEGLTATLKITSEEKNKAVTSGLNLGVEYSEDGSSIKGSIEANSEIKAVDGINKFDTANAKKFDELTEADLTSIMTKLEEKTQGTWIEMASQLLSMFGFGGGFDGPETDYDFDDYDFDFSDEDFETDFEW